MNGQSKYLYDNSQADAEKRLKGLEAVEDENSISMLKDLIELQGCTCLDIGAGAGAGAGAGSIAEWLATQVGPSGTVTATDIEPQHLSGSGFDVRRHDIEKEELPISHYDLVHIRHVLIHIADPIKVLQRAFSSMKSGAVILAEESDLSTWEAAESTPGKIRSAFQDGVDAIRSIYKSRGMDIRIGTKLKSILTDVGFTIVDCRENRRSVTGGTPEAEYQRKSAYQMAASLGHDNKHAATIRNLADCLTAPDLQYQSRTTISVSAAKRP